MILLTLLIFFCFGLIFGSFSTVLIERWHSGKGGIMMGRSECPHCHHILWTRDLFPVFSYIWSRGKCSYCSKSIPLFYPWAELLMGSIFAILAYAAIDININLLSVEMLLLLFFGFVTGVYVLYDLRYMEIPDQIIVPALYLLLIIPFFSLLFIWLDKYTFHTFHISFFDRLFWAMILYTFFYLQILIPGGWYLIRKNDYTHLWELILNYFTFPIVILIEIWRKSKSEDTLEIPTWIGGGDLRIALFIGLTLGTLHGISSFAFAYVTGSIVGILLLIYNAFRGKKTESQIPFGPFLGVGWILSIIFYKQIVIFYTIFL